MTLWMNILWCHRTTYLVLMYNVILDILFIALGDILVVALVSCGTWHPRRGILVVALVHPRRGTLGHHRSGLLWLSVMEGQTRQKSLPYEANSQRYEDGASNARI